jgi:hypothetical protein
MRSSSTNRHCLLVIGDWAAREFSRPLRDMKRFSQVRCLASLDEAMLALQRGLAPTHVVFAQARRGRFSDHDVARIHRLCPLAQLISLLGTWCEGEMRTGEPLAGVARFYWHQWRPQLLAGREDCRRAHWAQPRTYTLFDQSLRSSSRPTEAASLDSTLLNVAVGARRQSDYQGLAAALDRFTTFWANRPEGTAERISSPSSTPPDWLVWDAQAWDALEQTSLQDALQRLTPVATLLLISWPRHEDVEVAERMGVRLVLSKPFRLNDLTAMLGLPRQAAA